MSKKMRIGTRPSRLALKQVEEVKRRLPDLSCDVITIETQGDKDKVTPLSEQENSDFFTRQIERALLDESIDVAVHSAKDIEDTMPEGLTIAAITCSISPLECLVARDVRRLKDLPFGSVIGTSSRKRKASIKNFRKDIMVKDIRGNIDERIRQLDRGDFDAIIVAHAALLRLGYQDRITEIIPSHIIEPHPLQGRLAVQVKRNRTDMIELFRGIDER